MSQNFGSGAHHRIPLFAIILFGMLVTGSNAGADSQLDLTQYKGKVVVVDFWASWCVPCRRSFPWLNNMQEKYGDEGLVIVGVNMDSDTAEAHKFLQEFPADFTIIYDSDRALGKQYSVEAMPTSFVIGRNGEIVANHLGFKVKKQDEYEQVLVETLNKGED
jgi:cytochrome c biogenesis protein CcmG/thiol:disulfide interchange protein DsbE